MVFFKTDSAILQVFADVRSLSALIRKMVSLLEAVEKLPQLLYDNQGASSIGLQILSRRIKLRLEQLNATAASDAQLLNR